VAIHLSINRDQKLQQQGFVLVAALWLAALAIVIATEFTLRVRTNVLLATRKLQTSELSAIADGMIRLTVWKLANGKPAPNNGERTACSWKQDVHVVWSIQDHGGLVDVNLAAAPLVANVFRASGASESVASTLVSELFDYRDIDNLTSGGNEESQTRSGAPNKNLPLETVEEIDLLPSMTDEIYWKSKDFLTTLSGQQTFDPATAPRLLKESLGFAPETSTFHGPSQKRSFRLEATAFHVSGATSTTSADVILILQPEAPYRFITWNTHDSGKQSPPKQIVSANPCVTE
jgi:general secretion pathway protein K